MFVLGIDPGLTRCGYGCISSDKGSTVAIAAGVITTPVELDIPSRLLLLANEIEKLLIQLKPNIVVVERVFFQTNARTAIPVAQAAGIALVAAMRFKAEVVEYSSNEVKQAIAGYGSAQKHQMQSMVKHILKLPTIPNPPDVADALGLALCHVTLMKRNIKVTQSNPSENSQKNHYLNPRVK